VPEPGSAAHWLTDHSLGVGRRRDGATLLYTVAHPAWALREVGSTCTSSAGQWPRS
jgi:hypothetical protein